MLSAFISFLLGCGLTYAALKARSRPATNHQDYKKSWEEAVNLLHASGQLTDEQLAKLLPPKRSQQPKLREMDGFSDDRAAVEIARAEHGLPPLDNLENMYSDDRAAVELARIKYGTAI